MAVKLFGRLALAPLNNPQKVLDVGTGNARIRPNPEFYLYPSNSPGQGRGFGL